MRLYEILLGRKADEPGLRGWVSCMVDGLTRQKIILSFADSSEFKARGLSGHDVVTALFNACVGRDPITVEINKYTAFLQKNGMTATIKRIMAESI